MLDHDVWQWRATAYCRKWISNKKVLNGCISTLWDDVRLDLDEYVILRECVTIVETCIGAAWCGLRVACNFGVWIEDRIPLI